VMEELQLGKQKEADGLDSVRLSLLPGRDV
jgi:hypothetical protein